MNLFFFNRKTIRKRIFHRELCVVIKLQKMAPIKISLYRREESRAQQREREPFDKERKDFLCNDIIAISIRDSGVKAHAGRAIPIN